MFPLACLLAGGVHLCQEQKVKIGIMDEEDSVQEHSLESEQPKKKRTREAKKDEKRKKKKSSTFQELSPEGGKC